MKIFFHTRGPACVSWVDVPRALRSMLFKFTLAQAMHVWKHTYTVFMTTFF